MARRTISGKNATSEEIAAYVGKLLTGDPKRKILPIGKSEIARSTGWSRQQIDRDSKLAIELGYVEIKDGKIVKPELKMENNFRAYKKEEFSKDEFVDEWVRDLQTKNDDGTPKKTWRTDYNRFKHACNKMKLRPVQWVGISKKEFNERMINLKELVDADPKSKMTTFHNLKMGCRLFCQFHGTALPKNMGGASGGKVMSHGQYPDVRLSDTEIEQAEKYIIEKHGLDSDIFRIFSIGIESGARKTALLNMECDWEILNRDGTEWYILKAYESKTEKVHPEPWEKFICRENTKESLRLHKAKGFRTIISHDIINQDLTDTYLEQLRDVYSHIGKQHVHKTYFMRKSFHALRHVATQFWIRRAKGNLTMVRIACGWMSDLELEKSYGKMPAEIVLGMLPQQNKIGVVA